MHSPDKPGRGGARTGAGRPAGSGRIDTSEPLTQIRVPVEDKEAVITLVKARQAARLASIEELAGQYPGEVLLPARLAPVPSMPLHAAGVRAGMPSPADDHVEDTLDLNHYLIDDAPSTFLVRAKGESMTGAHVFDGDILVVDKSRTPSSGDIVVAAIEGEFTVKRLQRQGGRVILQAANPDYPDIVPSYEQELVIWGVVTGCVRRF